MAPPTTALRCSFATPACSVADTEVKVTDQERVVASALASYLGKKKTNLAQVFQTLQHQRANKAKTAAHKAAAAAAAAAAATAKAATAATAKAAAATAAAAMAKAQKQ